MIIFFIIISAKLQKQKNYMHITTTQFEHSKRVQLHAPFTYFTFIKALPNIYTRTHTSVDASGKMTNVPVSRRPAVLQPPTVITANVRLLFSAECR